jgi:hypothetical protein
VKGVAAAEAVKVGTLLSVSEVMPEESMKK